MSDTKISALTSYTPAIDTDVLPIVDITTSTTKKITWANIKATLKTYFDTLYPAETATTLGALIGGAGNATPNDTDFVATSLTAAGILKKITWTNVKAFLKTYFDTLYIPLAGGTLTGSITFGENTALIHDAALSADGKYDGEVRSGVAGTTLAFGDLVYLAAADSRWELADADSATTADRFLGMCVLAAAADGDPTTILLRGFIRADAAFPSMTIGSPVYVGETAGDIQTAIPTGADNIIRRVGYAWTADELYFAPSMDSQSTVA